MTNSSEIRNYLTLLTESARNAEPVSQADLELVFESAQEALAGLGSALVEHRKVTTMLNEGRIDEAQLNEFVEGWMNKVTTYITKLFGDLLKANVAWLVVAFFTDNLGLTNGLFDDCLSLWGHFVPGGQPAE